MKQSKYGTFEWSELIKFHMTSMTQKRYYYSTLGWDNIREHITNGIPLVERDRSMYDFDNLFQWWVKKSVKRYENLKGKGTFRTELEHYGMGTEREMIR